MTDYKIDYDPRFDTLYVGIGNRKQSYGDDSIAGLILLRDAFTDKITGFTILSFKKRYSNHSLPELPKELHCSLLKDIIPRLSV